jgi:hypothetical protein
MKKWSKPQPAPLDMMFRLLKEPLIVADWEGEDSYNKRKSA